MPTDSIYVLVFSNNSNWAEDYEFMVVGASTDKLVAARLANEVFEKMHNQTFNFYCDITVQEWRRTELVNENLYVRTRDGGVWWPPEERAE